MSSINCRLMPFLELSKEFVTIYIDGFHSIFHHKNWRAKDHVMQSSSNIVM